MKGKERTIRLFLSLLAAVTALAGCRTAPHRRAALESLQAQLYSSESRTADRAALVLLSIGSDDAFRVAKRALANSSSRTTRAAVVSAFTMLQDPRIEEEALAFLGDESEEVVSLAKAYLEKVIGAHAADQLLEIARDERRSAGERVPALEILAKVGTGDVVKGLLDLLEVDDGEIARAATAALQGITYQPFGNEPARWRAWYRQNRNLSVDDWREVGSYYYNETQRLELRVTDRDAEIAERDSELTVANKRLVDLGVEHKNFAVVIEVLSTVRPVEAQVYAAEALGRFKVPEAAAVLIEKAQGFDTNLVKACLDALGAIGDPAAVPVVELNLSAGEPLLRVSAVKAYAMLKKADLSKLLPLLLSDSSSSVRVAAAEAIGGGRWHPGFDALIGALEDESPQVRAAAAGGLGGLGNRQAVAPLVKVVGDADEKVRWTAVRSLSQLADPAAVDQVMFEAFITATRDDVSGVKEAAVVGLSKLRDKRAVDRLLEMALEEPDTVVAQQAWTSLLDLVNSDADRILDLAETLEEEGRFDKAETMLKILADDTSETTDEPARAARVKARMWLADSYLAAGSFPAAEVYFRRVLAQRPQDSDAASGLATALVGLGNWEGLSGLYARRIIAGGASEEERQGFLTALRKLVNRQANASVVASIQQVIDAKAADDGEFGAQLMEIRAVAMPAYLESLVESLGEEDEAKSAEAEAALAQYGREASGALVNGLSSGSATVRTSSLELLVSLAGGTFGFDPEKDPQGQEAALEEWQAWLQATPADQRNLDVN